MRELRSVPTWKIMVALTVLLLIVDFLLNWLQRVHWASSRSFVVATKADG